MGGAAVSWRAHDTHAAETKAVKGALATAGIAAAVGHGTGTAWGWLEIRLGAEGRDGGWHERTDAYGALRCSPKTCGECARYRAIDAATLRIAQAVTGRSGEYHGEITISHQDHWAGRRKVQVLQSGEWSPEAWARADVLARKAEAAA